MIGYRITDHIFFIVIDGFKFPVVIAELRFALVPPRLEEASVSATLRVPAEVFIGGLPPKAIILAPPPTSHPFRHVPPELRRRILIKMPAVQLVPVGDSVVVVGPTHGACVGLASSRSRLLRADVAAKRIEIDDLELANLAGSGPAKVLGGEAQRRHDKSDKRLGGWERRLGRRSCEARKVDNLIGRKDTILSSLGWLHRGEEHKAENLKRREGARFGRQDHLCE